MTLTEVRDWLKTQTNCPQWYIGKIDGAKDQCIGLYDIQGPPPNLAIGGLNNTSYTKKAVSILIHWGNSPVAAEQKAREVYDCFFGKEGTIGGKRVIQFEMRTPEPVGVGTDENGIYEYVIETIIYYER